MDVPQEISQTTQPEQKKSHFHFSELKSKKMLVIIALVFWGAVAGIIYFIFTDTVRETKNISSSSAKEGIVLPLVKMKLNDKKAWLSYRKEGDSIIVKAFSEGKDISGYDVLASVDFGKYDLKEVVSLKPEFSVYTGKRAGYLSITGIKELNVNTPTLFNKEDILRINLKPKTGVGGVATIVSTVSQNRKEKTKFVDSSLQVLYPQIQMEQGK
ncbi:MAG: hypothetical protein Q7S61_00645 [bacterium]|nr:hypothetical protein [bacterium]